MEELNQSQSRLGLLCDWFIFPLLLPTPTIWLSLDRIKSGIGRTWKRSDSSDSDSVALMTLLTTPVFDFHQVKRSYDSVYDSDSESVVNANQSSVILLQIVMLSLGNDPVKNHESLSVTSES